MGLYVAIPLVLFIIVLLWIVPVGLWLQAIFSIGGGHVTIFSLIGMRFRRVPPSIIVNGLIAANKAGIECHAGHGLTFETVPPTAAIPNIVELNIGHFLIGEAIFGGLSSAIKRMRVLMDQARTQNTGNMTT